MKGEIVRHLIALVSVLALVLTSVAIAGNENGNKLLCFDGTTDGGFNGVCTLTEDGATLNTIDGDANPNNNYAGVYIQNTNLDKRVLSHVHNLSFTYDGSVATGGSPRFSIPIDEDGDGTTEAYAFVDTLGCNDGSPNSGELDVIRDATCLVAYGTVYANWDAFASANPTYRIASDALTFVIVDQPGLFEVTDVRLGKGPAKPTK
jgi:hypothetical protein